MSNKGHEIIEETIDKYADLKGDNDYSLNYKSFQTVVDANTGEQQRMEINPTPTHINIITEGTKSIPFGTLISNEFRDRLHPDNIDIKHFWKYAISKFPYFPISGHPDCKSSDDVNKSNMFAHKKMGVIKKLDSLLGDNISVLEIGPGYGNVRHYVRTNFPTTLYRSIDINPLINENDVIECDGQSIPDSINMNFDVTFSVNVFQHLSPNQRSSYYNEVYDILNPGGTFIFTMFLVHPQNENSKQFWGFIDENGRAYCQMLSQVIEIDRFEEIDKELREIGFEYELKILGNLGVFYCTKNN